MKSLYTMGCNVAALPAYALACRPDDKKHNNVGVLLIVTMPTF